MDSDHLFDRLELMAVSPGLLDKLDLLRGVITFKPVLYYAYNPYIKFGMKYVRGMVKGRGYKKFDTTTWGILKELSEKRGTTKAEARRVLNYARSLSPKSCRLFLRIIDKDLRAGISRGLINRAFPGLIEVHQIMLANPFRAGVMNMPCFSSYKYNGNRGTFTGKKILSRDGREYHGLNHIIQELKGGPPVDGELVVPGVPFDIGSGMIRDEYPVPLAVFMAFDLPNSKLPFDSRYLHLIQTIKKNKYRYTLPVEHRVLLQPSEILADYKRALAQGYEGLVIKDRHHIYKPGKSNFWLKIKPVYDAICKVIGTYEGQGKYEGMLGGVWVDFNGVKVKVGSGISDDLRVKWWKDRRRIVGRNIRVEYSELNMSGSMRHPRYAEGV